jgi:tetratricopeptide (TPR) repeat protein
MHGNFLGLKITRYDYACFCLRNGESAKGEECLQEALSRNSKHIPSLLSYGALCCVKKEFEQSKICFSSVLDIDPENAMAHSLFVGYQSTYNSPCIMICLEMFLNQITI